MSFPQKSYTHNVALPKLVSSKCFISETRIY